MTFVQEVISECSHIVLTSKTHDLPLGARQLVWSILGEKGSNDNVSLGHYRRYTLAKECVYQVVPIWERVYRSSLKIDNIIDIANHIFLRNISTEKAMIVYRQYWNESDRLAGNNDLATMAANAVSYAATQLIFTALKDEAFHSDKFDLTLSNDTLDPYELDPAMGACYAYANGGSLDLNSDTLKRRDFWLWWLSEIPKVSMIDRIPENI